MANLLLLVDSATLASLPEGDPGKIIKLQKLN